MPWRLIQFILIFAMLLVFVFFNIDNKCDINFGFTRIRDAPVYLTAFTSFVIGMAVAFLSAFVFKRRSGSQDRSGKNSAGKKTGGKGRSGENRTPENHNLPAKNQRREKTGGYSETEAEGGGFTDGNHYGID